MCSYFTSETIDAMEKKLCFSLRKSKTIKILIGALLCMYFCKMKILGRKIQCFLHLTWSFKIYLGSLLTKYRLKGSTLISSFQVEIHSTGNKSGRERYTRKKVVLIFYSMHQIAALHFIQLSQFIWMSLTGWPFLYTTELKELELSLIFLKLFICFLNNNVHTWESSQISPVTDWPYWQDLVDWGQ